MENQSDAKAEIMLRRAVKAIRVVINLKRADAQAVGCFDVKTAAEGSRKSGIRFAKILAAVNAGLLAEAARKKRAVNLGSGVSDADESVSERTKARTVSGIVLNLNAA